MERHYKHLNAEERGVILAEHQRGSSLRQIGWLLGRHHGTIGLELTRGATPDRYDSHTARLARDAEQLRSGRRRKLVPAGPFYHWVRNRLIHWCWSPEQIAARLRRMHPDDPGQRVSHALTGRVGPPSPYLLSGVGLQLQYIDAQIAERVLLHFSKMQVPCLTMHDSFIVMSHYQDELREAMACAFTEVVGVAPKMKSSHSTLISHPRLQNGPHGTAIQSGHFELDATLARQRLHEFWDYSGLRANSSLADLN